MNTAIITEKSVRKAQDKHLAEQLDIFSKQMSDVSHKMNEYIDTEGQVKQD